MTLLARFWSSVTHFSDSPAFESLRRQEISARELPLRLLAEDAHGARARAAQRLAARHQWERPAMPAVLARRRPPPAEVAQPPLAEALPETEVLLEREDDAPIIRLINALLTQAVRENASDVHIETFEKVLQVRFRVDGVLREVVQPRRALAPLLVSRIKVMAKLDIAEKRIPQDGRIPLRIGGREIDLRVSTLPTGNGERVVLEGTGLRVSRRL